MRVRVSSKSLEAQARHQHPQQMHTSVFIICCTLLILSGCSLFPTSTNTGVGPTSSGTPVASTRTPANTSPTPAAHLSDSDLVRGIMDNMTLEQKLGQMVIV